MSDATRARYECLTCGLVEYCDAHRRAEFPPDAALREALRRHSHCPGQLRYLAGIRPGCPITGQDASGSPTDA